MSQQGPANVLFEFTRDGDRWECRPSAVWGHVGLICFLAGAAFLLSIGGKFFRDAGDRLAGFGFGALFLLGAALLLWTASRYRRLRHTPLAVDGTGRVTYGHRELCPADSVRSVQVVPDPQAESGDCKVVLECADGSRVELPGPFFAAVSRREAARELAGELAKALKVGMAETD